MISLIQLEYIVAVDTYRHFVTAAEKCFVTQPTLSMQVKKMEDFLGVKIFDRTKQPVIPTIVGEKIIDQARRVLHESNRIEQIVQEEKNDLTGELRIGIIPTISPYLLPLFSGKFKKDQPKLKLFVHEIVTDEIIRQLKKDLIDVGILVTPINDAGINELPLYYEEMLIYSNKHHRFANNTTIKIKDIASSDIWLLNDGHCFRHQVINLCKLNEQEQSKLPFEFEGGSLETLIKIIDKEGGFTLIPELAGIEMGVNKKDQISSFSNILPLREVSLVYTRKYEKAKLLQVLAETIKLSVPESLLNKERGSIVEWR
jgi:LysR family hydrogen peroxide-inducible transcriptional activator